MRSTYLLLGLLIGCGGNDVDPRVIPGGGVGDGAIDGEVNVHVIDDDDNPIANATVSVGGTEQETDEDGLAVFSDVSGKQTIAVLADGFRATVWAGVNGANVTIPLNSINVAAIDQATLSGSIAGWDAVTVPANHLKAAAVFYSQTDDLGDDANNLATPNMGNICGALNPTICNWQLTSRTGNVTVIAAILDIDPMGTADSADDVIEVIGWATRDPLTVEDGINQQGIELAMVEAGNLQTVTVDFGAPPAGLPENAALVGIELGNDEVIQLPLFLVDTPVVLAPKPSVFGADATYRLTAVAQTTSGDLGAQSIVIRRGNTGTELEAGEWLVPPTGLAVTRADAAWERSEGANIHQLTYRNELDENILEVTIFDNASEITLPALVLPVLEDTLSLTARVGGLGATIDVNSFSLDDDSDKIFALAAEPTDVD